MNYTENKEITACFQKHHLFIDIFKRPVLHSTLSESTVNFRERADPPCYPPTLRTTVLNCLRVCTFVCIISKCALYFSNVLAMYFNVFKCFALPFHALMAIFRLHNSMKKKS